MARVTVILNGEKRTFALDDKGLNIGRQLDNDVVLNHAIVSRRHARVELRGRNTWVSDLASRNGLQLNRLRVKEDQLADGDVITIGPFDLHFEDRAAQSVTFDDNKYFPLSANSRQVESGPLPMLELDLHEFYRISTRLNQLIDYRELLHVVLEEVLRVVPSQRGFLLLRKGQELVPMVVIPSSEGDATISSSIVRKTLEGGEAVLTRDARLDFSGSQSIISANIRSAISAPLIVSGATIGLIYLDSPGREKFSERDRDIVAAIASQSAGVIERARLTEELRQQAQQMQNLERFLSPNVARAMARYFSQYGKLWEAQEQMVTVVFVDVKGFSALSEQFTPREVQDLLNDYLHEMTEVVFRHNGTLDKYMGDGIMAVFGAPRLPDESPSDDHATQAVDAALEMQAAQQRLIEKNEPGKGFAIRVGVNSGLAYTGFFGTRHRLEYTAIGDTVNTAARLESAAEPGSVFIGDDTRALI
ncbi:MAG: FHA domain-containing protein, partial [Chloroflexales bacterium]|nr:FHA domain-containing protein [Chloroflexales bacterium]